MGRMSIEIKSSVFKNERDLQLLEAVKAHPALYDPHNVKYMDGIYKNSVWKDIAKKLKSHSATCKSRWYNIRDQYRKSLLRCARQQAEKYRQYKYTTELSFLNPYYDFNNRVLMDNSSGEENEEGYTVEGVKLAKDLHEDQPANTNETDLLNLNLTAESFMEFVTEKYNIVNKHPVDAFLAGLAPVLKTLSPLYLHQARSEIFQVVQRYEMKMFKDKVNVVVKEEPTNLDPLIE